jgi:hypothetical protein
MTMTEIFENGILTGWESLAFNPQGHQVKVFIPRRDEDIHNDRIAQRQARRAARARQPAHTAAIRNDGHRFYISYLGRGTRSRKDYKTEAGARRAADQAGEVLDPAPAEYVRPIYLDPTSETYRCA